eukprot:jgi/Botrbrau1/3726/Bobra.0363s0011.1
MAAPALPSGFAGPPTQHPRAFGAYSPFPTSLHGSVEAAIVVSFLFALGWCFCLANFGFTKYQRYFVQSISCLFRCIGFACRAAAIEHFSLGLYAASFAGAAAGFGISIAVLILVLADWVKHARLFKESSCKWIAYRAVIVFLPCIIILGPISGIASAIITFGDFGASATRVGLHLREAAVYGMISILGSIMVVAIIYLFLAFRHASRNPHEGHDDMMLGVLVGLGLILGIRGAAGAAALTHPIINAWETDFYTLQSLPELLELALVCIPTLLARIGKASFVWPSAHQLTKRASERLTKEGASFSPTGSTSDESPPSTVSGKAVPPV